MPILRYYYTPEFLISLTMYNFYIFFKTARVIEEGEGEREGEKKKRKNVKCHCHDEKQLDKTSLIFFTGFPDCFSIKKYCVKAF